MVKEWRGWSKERRMVKDSEKQCSSVTCVECCALMTPRAAHSCVCVWWGETCVLATTGIVTSTPKHTCGWWCVI